MKYANEALFLVFSLLLSGLFVSSAPYFRGSRSNNFNNLWLIGLGLNILAFLSFASASTISPLLLTLANTCFFTAYFFLALFSRSINGGSTKSLVRLSPLIFIVFACVFEYLRRHGAFQARVLFVVCALIACLVWILIELFIARKKRRHIQLDFLMFTTLAELTLGLVRLWMVLSENTTGNINLYEEPFVSTLVRWFGVSFAVLSYFSVVGYCAESLSKENEKNIEDRIKIEELLKEREALIANLLKANRTSATGALSASIAHELNQPLGASNLNIQFLRMKLDGGLLNDDISREILDSLEADNKRAANIVRSLRSIFTDSESPVQECRLSDLTSNILSIASPELKLHNIRLDLKIEEGLMVWINASEMEQVILNLINNAIQSLGKTDTGDRVIVIEARQLGQLVQMRVTDNGHGVPKEFKANLFELLSTTKNSGMGLGLWLCKHIVTRSGGSIWHEDAPDQGAIFIVELPAAG